MQDHKRHRIMKCVQIDLNVDGTQKETFEHVFIYMKKKLDKFDGRRCPPLRDIAQNVQCS
jgi:hypothetical protein